MLLDRVGKEILFLDGGMGTLLQQEGLQAGELPEIWNIERADKIIDIHQAYLQAGSQVILTNTFGANGIKLQDAKYPLQSIVESAVENVRLAATRAQKTPEDYLVALDVGPTGKLLKPMGDLSFEDAYETFKEVMQYGEAAGVDLIYIETMSDTYEAKAAILAAKENTSLPVFTTVIFDEKGKLLTGADVPSVVAMLEGLRVDAIGMNCGMGPKQMLPILQEMVQYSSLPIIVKPNAGLPKQRNGDTYFDIQPQEFAQELQEIVGQGACVIGGCCGTTPQHIQAMVEACKGSNIQPPVLKEKTIVSSYAGAVEFTDKPIVIGERINPTGKKKFKQALKEHDIDYILREAITQQERGAHILDVNVGLPDIDEVSMMKEVVMQLQSVTSLPLQIDTVNERALDAAMRIYNGKPMVNSVNGKQECMDEIFPLIKKYGGVVVGLTLDENGIPTTAEERADIAGKIITEAAKYGIAKKDIVIDVLTMAISADPGSAKTTLDALKLVRDRYGVKTVLGVSNISFGLPNRALINANFYTMAMQNGLSAGIINPSSEAMMNSYYAYCALMEQDSNCQDYIAYCDHTVALQDSVKVQQDINLQTAITKGLKEDAVNITRNLVQTQKPLEIIEQYLIPALDIVGKGFENGTVFLPQLLMSAEAAKQAFSILQECMSSSEESQPKKHKVILATVKGDVHDIGKNIVKVLLENYSFDVLDLGKDVPPEQILEVVLRENVSLVGLSALMTTTVASMEKTIQLLRENAPQCKIMVGGAVLNQEYADAIGADFYGKDAMQSVYYAQSLF